jgi:hypothetical protein
LMRDPRESARMFYGNKYPPKDRLVTTIAEARRKRLTADELAERLLETFRDHDRANNRARSRERYHRRKAETAA